MRLASYRRIILFSCFVLAAASAHAGGKASWWKPEWTIRKKVTIDAGAAGVTAPAALGTQVVLLRLHEGNFSFTSAKEDGSDMRFVAADDKTLLPHHIEKFDALLNEAFVWVKVPEVTATAPLSFWLYYGNAEPSATSVEDTKATYDPETLLVYHFSEHGAAASDSTVNVNHAQNPAVAVDGTIIGTGIRLDGKAAVKLPESPTLTWSEGSALTWTAWIKPATLQANAILFSRRDAGTAMLIGLDSGLPFVEVTTAAGTQRGPASEALAIGVWRHLAVIFSGSQAVLLLDGKPCATLNAALPALKGAAVLGNDVAEDGTAATSGFNGEIDELEISRAARPVGALLFAALSQGTGELAGKLVAVGSDEESAHGGEGELAKHLSLITDISKSLTLDGWIVIVLCIVLAVVGWVVTVLKLVYLNKIKKATAAFLALWEHISTDLSLLDHGDEESVKSMGGKATGKTQRLMRPSPLYHIYQIGSSEIQHRLSNSRDGFRGLSGRSMQSIRATLDGGLVREVQRLNSQLVFLTIGIAGGPYLGLLGTVIGVMITFAVIAKSGQVEVNSIAPGIAGALLATVAGLAVAIPALFAYSYISSRIKDSVSDMQIFIDEFVAKIAEAFPTDTE
jgi:biopolymer transport protein ExbB